MPTLRLTQNAETDGTFPIVLELTEGVHQKAEATVPFRLTPEDEADIRWYLEDFLRWPPGPGAHPRQTRREAHGGAGGETLQSSLRGQQPHSQAVDDRR